MTTKKLHLGIVGMGRIGKVHLKSIALNFPEIVLHVASKRKEGRAEASRFGVQYTYKSIEELVKVKEVDAVLICSATDTHVEYVYRCINARKHIFCEKPLAFELDEIRKIDEAAKESGVKLMVGFNQRFDTNWSDMHRRVVEGEIGSAHLIQITSRDPVPPSIEFAKVSGGLFLDMTIHDFDLARYITGKEVKEVYATGQIINNPQLAQFDDVDFAIVILTFVDQSKAIIHNTRESADGYDQRVEVFGSEGRIQGNNQYIHTNTSYNKKGMHGPVPLYFFMERYERSYLNQIKHFIDALQHDLPVIVGAMDVFRATEIALAARKSVASEKPVKVYG